jgi:cell division protein ZapA
MADHLTTVDLLGVSFTIRSKEEPEYIKDVVAYYRMRVEEAAANIALGEPLKVAVVAALNVVDELFKERLARAEARVEAEAAREAGQITSRLIAEIDRALQPAPPGGDPTATPPASP